MVQVNKQSIAIVLVCIPILSHTEQSFAHLHALNTLTMRPATACQYKIATLDQCVYYINAHNEVPFRMHLEINDSLYTIYRGIFITSSDPIIFIVSRGYAKTNIPGMNENFIQRGACATEAYRQIYYNIVNNAPLVCFDYDDSRNGFSFGQTDEIETLYAVYTAVLAKNPATIIILIGDCRGAKVALELATQNPKNLGALILLAPFISAKDLTHMIADNHLPYLPFSRILLHHFFKLYFPNYDEKKETLETRLSLISPTIPIFIAHRKSDNLVSTVTINRLAELLQKENNTMRELHIIDDTTYEHSRLPTNSTVQTAINAFLKKHGFPYNPILCDKDVV